MDTYFKDRQQKKKFEAFRLACGELECEIPIRLGPAAQPSHQILGRGWLIRFRIGLWGKVCYTMFVNLGGTIRGSW